MAKYHIYKYKLPFTINGFKSEFERSVSLIDTEFCIKFEKKIAVKASLGMDRTFRFDVEYNGILHLFFTNETNQHDAMKIFKYIVRTFIISGTISRMFHVMINESNFMYIQKFPCEL